MADDYLYNKMKQEQRDLSVLRELACGICAKKDLAALCFTTDDGQTVSRQVMERRLRILEAAGFVESKKYKTIYVPQGFAVFSLTLAGVSKVADTLKRDRDNIRFGFPSLPQLKHELILAAVARKIWREHYAKKYNIRYAVDDRVLKRVRSRKKNVFYPDLYIDLTATTGTKKIFDLETFCGAKSSSYWVPKIKSMRQGLIIVTSNQILLDRAIELCRISERTWPTLLCIADSFIKGGLCDTQFYWLPDAEYGYLKI